MPLSKLELEFPGEIPLDYQVSRRCGEAFQPPRADLRQIFSVYGKHRATSLVIAVSRSDRSLVVFREGISQLAGLAWRQITVANRRYDQPSNHIVRVNYELLNGCRIRSVGDVQFCSNELVRQNHEPVALRGTIQDLK